MTFKCANRFPPSVKLLGVHKPLSARPLLLLSALVGSLLSPNIGWAAEELRLEEVLVSARKKTESLQDTPISVSYTHLTLPTNREV